MTLVGKRGSLLVIVGIVGAMVVAGPAARASAQSLVPDELANPTPTSMERIAGSDRFETAAAIAMTAFPDGADTVYVARGDVFADALASGGLADGPVLLHPSCGEPLASVSQAITQLDPARVIALGGSNAICADVLADLAGGREAGRLEGASRVDTAIAIAQRAAPGGAGTVYLASAQDRPDAVVAGVLDGPVLLVPYSGDLPVQIRDELRRLDPERAVILGGASAVSDRIAQQVADEVPTAQRIAGPDRLATAAAISSATFGASPTGLSAATVYLARADVYADAVAGGALRDGPILLAPSCGDLPEVLVGELARLEPEQVVALGGGGVLCDGLLEQAAAAATPDPVRVSQDVIVLTDEELDTVVSASEDGQLVFRPAPPILDEVKEGETVLAIRPGAAFAPQGASAVVEDLTRQGEQATVTTRPAEPDEVFTSGRLRFEPVPGDEPPPQQAFAQTHNIMVADSVSVDVDVDLPQLQQDSVIWEKGKAAQATWTTGYTATVTVEDAVSVSRTFELFQQDLARWRLGGFGPFAVFALPQVGVDLSVGVETTTEVTRVTGHAARVSTYWTSDRGFWVSPRVERIDPPATAATTTHRIDLTIEASLRLAFTGGFLNFSYEKYFAAGLGAYLTFKAGFAALSTAGELVYRGFEAGLTMAAGLFVEASLGPNSPVQLERQLRVELGSCCEYRSREGHDPAVLAGLLGCHDGCEVTGIVPYAHPTLGRLLVVGSIGYDCFSPRLTAFDDQDAIRWDWQGGGCGFSTLAPAGSGEEYVPVNPGVGPVDDIGHVFFDYNPGRLNGVFVLHPTDTGFDGLGTLWEDVPGGAPFYYAQVVDVQQDGVFEILQEHNDCDPNCAGGSYFTDLYSWNGTAYVTPPAPPSFTVREFGISEVDNGGPVAGLLDDLFEVLGRPTHDSGWYTGGCEGDLGGSNRTYSWDAFSLTVGFEGDGLDSLVSLGWTLGDGTLHPAWPLSVQTDLPVGIGTTWATLSAMGATWLSKYGSWHLGGLYGGLDTYESPPPPESRVTSISSGRPQTFAGC